MMMKAVLMGCLGKRDVHVVTGKVGVYPQNCFSSFTFYQHDQHLVKTHQGRQLCQTIGNRKLTAHPLKTSGDAVMLLMEAAYQRLVSGHDDFCPERLMSGIQTK